MRWSEPIYYHYLANYIAQFKRAYFCDELYVLLYTSQGGAMRLVYNNLHYQNNYGHFRKCEIIPVGSETLRISKNILGPLKIGLL